MKNFFEFLKALFCRHAAAKYIETLGGARLQAGNISFNTPHRHECPTCGREVYLAEKRNV